MRPIPVAFHIWFLEVHTYGIGLALTFWFGLRYTERRLRRAGYPWQWVTGMFVWVIVPRPSSAPGPCTSSPISRTTRPIPDRSSPSGRAASPLSAGCSSPCRWPSSARAGAAPSCRPCASPTSWRRCSWRAGAWAGCSVPSSWSTGAATRPTSGSACTTRARPAERLPVPIFQAIEDFAIFGILLLVERWLASQAPTPVGRDSDRGGAAAPAGIVIGVGMVLWGIERFLDEHLWLGEDGHLGSLLVQIAGIALVGRRAGPVVHADRTATALAERSAGPGAPPEEDPASEAGEPGGGGTTTTNPHRRSRAVLRLAVCPI